MRPSRFLSAALAVALSGFPLWLAAPARAAPDADEAQFRFVRGNGYYRQGRFEDALSEYYLSLRLVPNPNVQFNVARCLEKLHRFDEAFRSWSVLRDAGLPDAERATVHEAIDRLRPQLALVEVQSDPPGADIYVSRRDLGSVGQTPKLIAAPEGTATLLLEKDGYHPREVKVETQRRHEQTLKLKLDRIYGRVILTGLPAAATVRLDSPTGELLRTGPGAMALVPDTHTLFVTAPGYDVTRLQVDVRADATTTLPVALQALEGSIVVRANVEGALVRVDGREVGFTPLVIEKVALGSRIIEASKEGYGPQRAEVDVHQGEPAYLDLRLPTVAAQVSSASKELVAAAEAPASISVITAAELAAFGYTTLADALVGVRGVFVSDDRIYRSVGFRGLSPPGDYTSRVLVLIDGHPTNDVLTGQGYVGNTFDVDLSNVERIEVARGPGSVLYGTGALFGVINVVTRRPAPGVHAAIGGQNGTLGLQEGRATASVRGQKAELAVSAGLLRELGDRRFAWTDVPGGPVAINADAEHAEHADLHARFGPVTLQAGWNLREKAVPTGAFEARPAPGTTYQDERTFVELRAAHAFAGTQISARLAYDASRFRGHYQIVPADDGTARPDLYDRFSARWATGELRLELPLLLRQHLTLGAEAQSQFHLDLGDPSAAAQRAGDGTSELVLSAYAVDEWRIGERLRFNLGLRADRYSHSFGTSYNPRLAVIGRPYDGGNTKLLVGRAFRAPSTYERFYNDGGVTQLQAGPLTPESVISAELEHAHTLNNELSMVGSLFAHRLVNLIGLSSLATPTGATLPLAYHNDPAQIRTVGAEGELRWEPQPGTLLTGALTWQRVRAYTGGTSTPFVNAPEAVAALRALYALVPERLRLGTEVVLDTGRRTRDLQRLDDAFLWNVTLSGAYPPWRARYFVGVFNLFDVKTLDTGFPVGAEVPSTTVPRYGRSARLGLQFAL